MNDKTHNGTVCNESMYDALYTALRQQQGDTPINTLVEHLRSNGHTTEIILGKVMKVLGPKAVARVKRIAADRAQHMATGTWQRYQMTRSKRFHRWLRGLQEDLEGTIKRLRNVLQRG